MRETKKMFSVFLCWVVLWSQTASINAGQTNTNNAVPPSLDEMIKLSSWQIREIAEKNDFNKGKIDEKIKEIEKANKAEKEYTKKIQKDAETKIKVSEKKLKDIPQSVTDPKAVAARQDLKCGIIAIKN